MNSHEFLFVITAYGFLTFLIVDQVKSGSGIYRVDAKALFKIVGQGAELTVHIFLILSLCFILESLKIEAAHKPPFTALILITAFSLAQIRRFPCSQFIVAAGLSLYVLPEIFSSGVMDTVLFLLKLCFGVTIVRLMIYGLQTRLLFLTPHKAVAGPPLLLVTVALVGLILYGLAGIRP